MKPLANTLRLLALAAGVSVLLVGPSRTGFAQTAPATPTTPVAPAAAAAPAAPAAPQVMGMEFTGFADAGYVNFSTGKGILVNGGHSRTFDFDNGVLSIQNIDLRLNKAPDSGFGGMIDLTLGKDADSIAAYGTIDRQKGPGTTVNQVFDVTQLFAYYGFGSGNVIAGKFVTHHGYEVITSRDNPNFSRSILFGFAIPFTHTGVRASWKSSDALTLMGGLSEGWDTIENKNKGSTGELGWEWTPSKAFSLFGTLMSGQEKVFNYPQSALSASPTGTRTLIDLVATYNASDSLTFVLNYDNGKQEKAFLIDGSTGTATWSGFAAYANYGINDNWRTSVRAESFNDAEAYRTGVVEAGKTKGPTWMEETVTVAYMGIKKTELRVEIRFDSADQKIFLDKADSSKALNSQTSIGFEAIYKF